MFAFSPDRHALNVHSQPAADGGRRVVRTGVSQPGAQPGSAPVVPTLPLTAPAEPVHERAFPQADGEP